MLHLLHKSFIPCLLRDLGGVATWHNDLGEHARKAQTQRRENAR